MACLNCIKRNGRPADKNCVVCTNQPDDSLYARKERAVASLGRWNLADIDGRFSDTMFASIGAPTSLRKGREYTNEQKDASQKAWAKRAKSGKRIN